MIVTTRMKEPTDQSSPRRRPLRRPAVQSHLLLRPVLPHGPRLSRAQQLPAGRRHTQFAPSLTQGSPWHGRDLAWSPGRSQGPRPLSPVTPATGQLGESRAPGCGNLVWGAEGTAMARCGESHAGWEINTKRLRKSLAALLPFRWNGEGPGRCGGRQVSAEGQTSQQVASTEPGSGVASYHAGVGLGSAGWLIASDGRGQHGVRLHKSPPVDQASKTQGGHVRTLTHTRVPGLGLGGRVQLSAERKDPALG